MPDENLRFCKTEDRAQMCPPKCITPTARLQERAVCDRELSSSDKQSALQQLYMNSLKHTVPRRHREIRCQMICETTHRQKWTRTQSLQAKQERQREDVSRFSMPSTDHVGDAAYQSLRAFFSAAWQEFFSAHQVSQRVATTWTSMRTK